MNKVAIFSAAALMSVSFAGSAFAQVGGGKGTPNENANCLAQERAQRNSAGGDRNPGRSDTTFGQQQSSFIAQKRAQDPNFSYGQFLKTYKQAGCPGAPAPAGG